MTATHSGPALVKGAALKGAALKGAALKGAALTRAAGPGAALTAAPWAGRLIGLVFVATVALFLLALVAL